MAKDGVHSGHRERLRARYLKDGLEGFEAHQILELLLFYSVPRKDTNDLAHKLLDMFGSLSGVLEAAPAELMKVEGIGESSAVLLSMMPAILRKYNENRVLGKPKINSCESAGEFAINLLGGRTYEAFYAICLNAGGEVVNTCKISEGTLDQAPAYPRLIIEAALNSKAYSVILAHNHPGGSEYPSKADMVATTKIKEALSAVDIPLRDHIIVTPKGYFSFKQSRMI